MMNYINYFKHTKHTPSYYYEQFENCFTNEAEGTKTFEQMSYIAKVAMPIISLHKPTNQALSFVSLSTRLITNISDLKSSEFLSKKAFKHMIATCLTTLSFAANFYNFTIGLYITTVADITQNLIHIYNYQFHEILPLIASSLYLAILHTGSLEIVLASLIFQVILNGVQVYKEAKKGDWVMAASKTIMMCMRGHQAQCQFELIQRRDYLYELTKLHALIKRIERTKEVDDLYDHPLAALSEKIKDRNYVLNEGTDSELDFGAHFSQIGKNVVKGMNVTFRLDEDHIQLEFKINHVTRQNLDKTISDLRAKELKELLSFQSHSFKSIRVTRHDETKDFCETPNWIHNINFEGLGSISVGGSPDVYNDYNTVKIKMGYDKSLYDFHEALCFLDLEQTLRYSSSQDIERLKLNQLFRLYNPYKASTLEHDQDYFNLSTEEQKNIMIQQDPLMQERIENDLQRMEFQEILPGRERIHMQGLSDELRELGADHLTAIITTGWQDAEADQYSRLCLMLKAGLLSTQMRIDASSNIQGLNSDIDIGGGNDSVYTQLVTKENASYDESDYSQYFPENIRLKINLDAVNSISYQYHDDSGGIRNTKSNSLWLSEYLQWTYLSRPQIHDFIKERMESLLEIDSNELMIKDRISPDLIEGIVVHSQNQKETTLNYLRQADLVVTNNEGQETILGKTIEDFIQVGQEIIHA